MIALKQSTDLENFIEVKINVEQNRGVEGFANLLSDTNGRELKIFFPIRLMARLKDIEGRRISCRVRRGGPHRIFAHPDYVEPKDS